MDVASDPSVHALVQKELGDRLASKGANKQHDALSHDDPSDRVETKGPIRRAGVKSSKKLSDMSPNELAEALQTESKDASKEYEDMQRSITMGKVHGLSELGLDLQHFTYQPK